MAGEMGAGAGGAEMLQQVLARKMQEQQMLAQQKMAQAKLAEDVRQANMQNAVQQGNLALGGRRVDEDVRQFDAQAPLRIANVGHLNASTADLQRRPQAEQTARDFEVSRDTANHTFTASENAKNRANATTIANTRANAPKVQQIAGIGPNGQKIVRLVDVNSGTELGSFDAGLSQEDFIARLQAEAAARAQGTAQGKQDAGGGGLFDMVAGLFGGGHKAAAPAAPGAGPKVGDVKQFANGKKAVWDGTGWAAQ